MPETITNSRIAFLKKLIKVLLLDYQGRLAPQLRQERMPQVAPSRSITSARRSIVRPLRGGRTRAAVGMAQNAARVHGVCLDAGQYRQSCAVLLRRSFERFARSNPIRRPSACLRSTQASLPTFNASNLDCPTATAKRPFRCPRSMSVAPELSTATAADRDSQPRIAIRRLDSVREIAAAQIALIKIDVEGNELAVLKGAAETIRRCKPVVIFEQQAREFADGHSPCVEFLRGARLLRIPRVRAVAANGQSLPHGAGPARDRRNRRNSRNRDVPRAILSNDRRDDMN